MAKPDTKPPAGTRDLFPEEIAVREAVVSAFRRVFEAHGYMPLETPALERIKTLEGKYGEEGEALIFRILKRGEGGEKGEVDLGLRYDFTVPLARVVAEYPSRVARPFRRYQMGPVWRADRPARGRLREFWQCDVDVVGTSSLAADAEVVLVVTEALAAVGLAGFTVKINSRKVLEGLMEGYGVPEGLRSETLVALDKLDKIGAEGVARELIQRGLPERLAREVLEDLTAGEVEERAREKVSASPVGKKGLLEVEEVAAAIEGVLEGGKLEWSPFLARGLDYYTGPIFEIFASGVKGAVASGGRYDDLIGVFSGRAVPATGGSIGLERVILALGGKGGEAKRPPVLVTCWDSSSRPEAFRLARTIRAAGVATEVYLEEAILTEQLRYASARGFRFVVIRGPEERARDEVALKDLRTGEQVRVGAAEVGRFLARLVGGERGEE